jgi:hypothetical protein
MASKIATSALRLAARAGRAADTVHSAAGKVEKAAKQLERGGKAVEFAAGLYNPRSRGLFPAGALGAARDGAGGVAAPMPIYLPAAPALSFPAYCECEPKKLEESGKTKDGTGIYLCHGCEQRRRIVFPNFDDRAEAAAAAAPAAAAARRAKSRSRSRGSGSERHGAGAKAGVVAPSSIVLGVKARKDRRPVHAASPEGAAAGAAPAQRGKSRGKSVGANAGKSGSAKAAAGAGAQRRVAASRKAKGNENSSSANASSGGGLRRLTRKLRKSK